MAARDSAEKADVPWLQLFLPFAAGFFLSYVYRTANAVIAPLIGQELDLSDGALGLLTSAYFLAFALAQLPVGVLLDRYGPRRVESALLVVAAAGAVIYGTAQDLTMLTVGRAVIGLGVSACLMGPLKAFAMAYPKKRLASLTSWIMVAGGVGAIAAAAPLEYLLGIAAWREVCLFGAGITLLVAVAIFLAVPESPSGAPQAAGQNDLRRQFGEFRVILRAPKFWRIAPAAFFFSGGFNALQGLWATRWISVHSDGDKMATAAQLTGMNVAVLVGMMLIGVFATPLVRRGIKLAMLYRTGMLLALLGIGGMVLMPRSGGLLIWPLLGLCFSLNSLAYTLISQAFPAAYAGRANSALNMLILLGAFGLQWGLGAMIDTFCLGGASLATAYQLSFGLLVIGQLLAWLRLAYRKPRPVGGLISDTPSGWR
ncbi:MFS transporter [Azonexus sp. IMCC34842]|uniref:MFS transporter n=1 Tax=Azonexus sp. IMCC34842 TaxID=3420950 RepID=UPI003D1524C3